MKLCFSTLGCTERSLEDILSLANKYGMDALEVRGIEGVLDNSLIPEFKRESSESTVEAFKKAGIKPLVLGTSSSFHDVAKYDSAIEEGIRAVDIASRLGFFGVRVFGDFIVGDERECIRRVAEGVYTLCRYAEEKRVKVLLEVHGEFNTIERLAPIVERCKESASFGLIWDVCHTRDTYPDWRIFYRAFDKYIAHVHLKDFKDGRNVLPGDGILPLSEIACELSACGYDGYFSLEWEKKWHPELPIIEEALDRYIGLF